MEAKEAKRNLASFAIFFASAIALRSLSIWLASVSLNRFDGGGIDAALSHFLLQRPEFADQLIRILNRFIHRRADFGNLPALRLGRARGRSHDAALQLTDPGAERAGEALEVASYRRVANPYAEQSTDGLELFGEFFDSCLQRGGRVFIVFHRLLHRGQSFLERAYAVRSFVESSLHSMQFHRGVECGAAVGLGDGDFRIALYTECVRGHFFAVDNQRDLILPRRYERSGQAPAAESAAPAAAGALLLNARLGKRLHAQIPERGVDARVGLALQRVARKFARHLAG